MNKTEFTAAVAAKNGMSKKDAECAVAAVLDTIKDTLAAGEDIQILGFGTFAVGERAARTCRNIKTGEPISVPATKFASFKPGKTLKDAVAK